MRTVQKGCLITPQVRSRELLTERGYLVSTVEQRKQFPDKKKSACRFCGHQPMISIAVDLWSCLDLLCEHPQKRERVYVQVTSAANHATRRNKVLSSFEVKLLLLAGARVVVQSWRKDDKANRWVCREEEITLKDYAQAFNYPNDVAGLMEIRRKQKKQDFPPGTELPLSADLGREPF